jgi:phosphatidylserine/phosphatidylglycerophosphate/cardiolipin synthase-like enzyme
MSAASDADDAVGLSEVSTDDLRQLASALAEGRCTPSTLAFSGFAHLQRPLAPLRSLDAKALLAVVHAVLAERRATYRPSVSLVWSGPDAGPSFARYTRVVVPELIEQATNHITLAGYSFDKGAPVFDRLHAALTQRHVRVRMFVDVHQLHERLKQQLIGERLFSRLEPLKAARAAGSTEYAREVIGLFFEVHWPYDGPRPEVFYDPRSADPHTYASLHAKCLVVDHQKALITSANFTGRGQDRNIEVGVLVSDPGYALALERQWENLVQSEDVVAWG